MAAVVFGATYLIAFLLHQCVAFLSTGSAGRSFKVLSPGMLSPLGVIFGLFVPFAAAQVWSDSDRAHTAVNSEASALRSVVVLASSLPGEQEERLRTLVQRYIDEAVSEEWPLMAEGAATLSIIPPPLNEALQATLALAPATPGQEIAQREIARSLEDALEARRQRILISHAEVNATKWACLIMQAVCALLGIALVHAENRLGRRSPSVVLQPAWPHRSSSSSRMIDPSRSKSRCRPMRCCRSCPWQRPTPDRKAGPYGSIRTPGLRRPWGSSAFFAARSASAKRGGRWRSYHGR